MTRALMRDVHIWAMAGRWRFDAVLLDLGLPGCQGVDAVNTLSSIRRTGR